MTKAENITITRADLLHGLTKVRLLQIAKFMGLWDQEKSLRKDLYEKLLSSSLYKNELLVDLLKPEEIQALCTKFRLLANRSNKDDRHDAVRAAVRRLKRSRKTHTHLRITNNFRSVRQAHLDLMQGFTKDRLVALASKSVIQKMIPPWWKRQGIGWHDDQD